MKTAKMLAILVLALGLMVWAGEISEAAPMGTAFTYQGRLMAAGRPVDGLYDFHFALYDDPDPSSGTQQGGTIFIDDLDVLDGYFTVQLDFADGEPDIYGSARWLEIGVRPGELEDPNEYTILSPRQELTPAPYALSTALGSPEPKVLQDPPEPPEPPGPPEPGPPWAGGNTLDQAYDQGGPGAGRTITADTGAVNIEGPDGLIVNGNVGIGTTEPTSNLHVASAYASSMKIERGSSSYLVNIDFATGGDNKWRIGQLFYPDRGLTIKQITSPPDVGSPRFHIDNSGNVGIGTISPGAKLEVNGKIKINGGSPGAGKVLTSDGSGLASWQTPAGGGGNNGMVPRGAIIMWSGSLSNIPAGWALCDGSNQTPDLRNRFILGVAAGENPGATGGNHNYTLNESQLPSHSHTFTTNTGGSHSHSASCSYVDPHQHIVGGNIKTGHSKGDANGSPHFARYEYEDTTSYAGRHKHSITVYSSGTHSHSGTTDNTGANQPFDNRPAYYKLSFIMKL